MATRFYLPYTEATTPISPTPDPSSWPTTTGFRRATTAGGASDDPFGTDTQSGSGFPRLFRQYVTLSLIAGQTITGLQTIKGQCRIGSSFGGCSLYLRISVYAADGTTLRKEVFYQSGAIDQLSATLTNKTVTGPANSGNYTTQAGDHLVIEIGVSSNASTNTMRFGYSAAAGWLPEDNTTTTELSPWVQLNDTLSFGESLSIGDGTFTVSGQNSQLTAIHTPATFDAGTFTVSGQNAAFTVGKIVTGDAGAFTLSGQAADLLATRVIVPDAGAFTLAGQASGLNHGFASQMDAGAFVVDGQDAGFVVGKGVAAGTGVFVVNGQDAALVYSGTPPVTGNGTQCDTLAWMLIDEPGGSW